MCSPVRVCFGKSDFLWQLMMTLIIYAIHLFLPQASSAVQLGIVSGWRSNEWISQHSAIHYLLHSGSEWLATDLRTHMLQRTSRQEQGPACQSNCQGKHKAEKTAGPLFPYAARCMPRMRLHMLIELYMIHWRGRRREERIEVWLEEKLCAGSYAAPIQMW